MNYSYDFSLLSSVNFIETIFGYCFRNIIANTVGFPLMSV